MSVTVPSTGACSVTDTNPPASAALARVRQSGELPSHHCPFCLLSSDYGYVGYGLYLSLAFAVIAGLGSGLVQGFRYFDRHDSIPAREERRLCRISMISFAVVAAIAWWPLLASPFRMGGY